MISLFKSDTGAACTQDDVQAAAKGVVFYDTHCERVQSLKNLIDAPKAGEVYFLWTLNSFNAFTFVPFCIRQYGRIDELLLSTYSISMRICEALIRLLDKKEIGFIDLLISDSIKFRNPRIADHLDAMAISRNDLHIRYGWNHSKISCMRCGENYLTVEGSGNWGENAQFEQYILINSKKVYEFRKENIESV